MIPTISMVAAEKVGRGLYLIAASDSSSFGLGKVNSMMTIVNVAHATRFYVRGPFYFQQMTGTCTLSMLPEGLVLSEGGTPAPIGFVPRDGTDKLPDM